MGNLVFAGALLAFGLIYYGASTQIPSNLLEDPVGASGFPRLLGIVIVGLSAVHLLQSALLYRRRRKAPQGDEPAEPGPGLRKFWPSLLLFATLVVFLAVFDHLGYLLAVTLMLLAVFHQTGQKIGWIPVGVAVLGALTFEALFGLLLGVRLPAGLLPAFY